VVSHSRLINDGETSCSTSPHAASSTSALLRIPELEVARRALSGRPHVHRQKIVRRTGFAKTKTILDGGDRDVPVPIIVKVIPEPGAARTPSRFRCPRAAEELYESPARNGIGKTLSEVFPSERFTSLRSTTKPSHRCTVISED